MITFYAHGRTYQLGPGLLLAHDVHDDGIWHVLVRRPEGLLVSISHAPGEHYVRLVDSIDERIDTVGWLWNQATLADGIEADSLEALARLAGIGIIE